MRSTRSFHLALATWLSVAGLVVTSLAANAARPPQPSDSEDAVRHPLTVRVTALDPVRRGQVVRVRVHVSSRTAIARGAVHLTSTGGATPTSPLQAAFGRLTPGRESNTDFAVRLPATGSRFLLQFRVTGEGTDGLAARGATLNLLPDGPAEARRVLPTQDSQVVETRARRIER